MKAYHFLKDNMCGGYGDEPAWKIGEQRRAKGNLEMCRRGYHAEKRLNLFTMFEPELEVRRIALTMEQIEELQPPPNPAKMTDSRFAGYVAEYGNESWELDALEPQYIANLIREQIENERNPRLWEEVLSQQEEERDQIEDVIKRWGDLF